MLKYRECYLSKNIIPNEYTVTFEMCDSYNEPGTKMFLKPLGKYLKTLTNITCICIDGGNLKPSVITYIIQYIYKNFQNLKIAWRNHAMTIPKDINQKKLHYLIQQDILYTKDNNNNWKLV